MERIFAAWLMALFCAAPAAADSPKVLVSGLKNPRAVAVGPDRRVYVTVCDNPEKSGTGAVLAIENGKTVPFASGLDAPSSMTMFQNGLFVADINGIKRFDRSGEEVRDDNLARFVVGGGMCVDETGTLYAATTDGGGKHGIRKITRKGAGELIANGNGSLPESPAWAGITMDGLSHLVMQSLTGDLRRLKLSDGSAEIIWREQVPTIVPPFNGLVWDHQGRLYRTKYGAVEVIQRPGDAPVTVIRQPDPFGAPCLSPDGKSILVPDAKAGTIIAIPTGDPTHPIDESPLHLETEIAFPDLEWSGWSGETAAGKPNPLRPLVLTHANDNSGRSFVATQHGVIHVFPNDQAAKKTKVFLDIQSKVRFDDNANEEGFLGLTFHPDYKRTGEFFVFYTEKTPGHHNVLSRFRVRRDDPDRADPASEEVLLRIQHKYSNHDGGTIIFGPDGCLYLALGDGGAGDDPDGNGQKLNTLLGKIIRIDVNRRDDNKPYAIPADNPFVGRKDARPEIFAFGLRNVWRMAFDRPTGRLWAADVGQNLYEEIDLIEKGGNFGWGIREGLHPFGPKGVGPKPDLVDPIWEYDHEVGKSIIGGAVYRGSRFPELAGHYLYADYVTGKIWALRYDETAKRVVANRPIADRKLPIMSFGEDDRGELYLMTYAQNGQGIYRFKRTGGVGSVK